MAVELESAMMRWIGLGQHYNWFNGSGSCGYIGRNAVSRLRLALQHCERGEMGEYGISRVDVGTKTDFERDLADANSTREHYREIIAEYEAKGKTPPADYVKYANRPEMTWKILEGVIGVTNYEALQLLGRISEVADRDNYTLTKTWEACSYIIQMHMYAATMTAEEQVKHWRQSVVFLREHYLPEDRTDDIEAQLLRWINGRAGLL